LVAASVILHDLKHWTGYTVAKNKQKGRSGFTDFEFMGIQILVILAILAILIIQILF
jgi:hypothetical protein